MTATVNSIPFTVNGKTVYTRLPPRLVTYTRTCSDAQTAFPICSGHSIDWGNCPRCDTIPLSINLANVTAGNFHAQRVATYRNHLGNVIGQLTIDEDYSTISSNKSSFIGTLSETYSGPEDIVNMSGHTQYFHQVGPGHISGSYTTTFTTSTGEILTRDVAADYTYIGSGVLPADESSVVTITSMTWDPITHSLTFMGTGTMQFGAVPFPPSPSGD